MKWKRADSSGPTEMYEDWLLGRKAPRKVLTDRPSASPKKGVNARSYSTEMTPLIRSPGLNSNMLGCSLVRLRRMSSSASAEEEARVAARAAHKKLGRVIGSPLVGED